LEALIHNDDADACKLVRHIGDSQLRIEVHEDCRLRPLCLLSIALCRPRRAIAERGEGDTKGREQD
jgi:hypothetical protein